jgi:alpha-beta hydrolase superfamily lysophospholipase
MAAQPAPQAAACPAGLPSATRCLAGRDSEGAHVLIALPARWNGHLVLHAHGGPLLGAPRAERTVEDLQRWAVVVKAGYAWAGSSFRQGGVAVRAAAEDTERLRRLFVQHVAIPKRTLLHGQSWGAGVAAKAAETFTVDAAGRAPYDAVLLTSGVLGGGTRSYDFRLDLRVVYQVLCGNHPRADEPAYPLWMGLPAASTLTNAELAARADQCLGLRRPAAQRTPEQSRKLKTLVDVLRIPERSVLGHLNWATFHFRDIAQERSNQRPVFGNIGARYIGSDDDAALNAAVQRYAADPQALRRFAEDTDPTGRIPVPVLTVHAIDDPVAFVELESAFRETMDSAGRSAALVQTFTDDAEHSYLADPVYPALLEALLAWVERGDKPTPEAISARCTSLEAAYGPGCRFRSDFRPAPLESRVVPRQRP